MGKKFFELFKERFGAETEAIGTTNVDAADEVLPDNQELSPYELPIPDAPEEPDELDAFKIVPCEGQLEGWFWKHWEDGSGHLSNADGTCMISYDRTSYYLNGWTEYRITADGCNDRWTVYQNTWKEFIGWAESWAVEWLKQHTAMKVLEVSIIARAVYNSYINVPVGMSKEEAVAYAKDHLDEISVGDLKWLNNIEVVDDNCKFKELREAK